jgi:hypothetical protein
MKMPGSYSQIGIFSEWPQLDLQVTDRVRHNWESLQGYQLSHQCHRPRAPPERKGYQGWQARSEPQLLSTPVGPATDAALVIFESPGKQLSTVWVQGGTSRICPYDTARMQWRRLWIYTTAAPLRGVLHKVSSVFLTVGWALLTRTNTHASHILLAECCRAGSGLKMLRMYSGGPFCRFKQRCQFVDCVEMFFVSGQLQRYLCQT